MLVAELIERLQAMPTTARVVVLNPDADIPPVSVDSLEYGKAQVRITLEDDFADDCDADDDDYDIGQSGRLSKRQHLGKLIGLGCWEGYPLCCVLFFAFVWEGLAWRWRGVPQSRVGRLLDRWPTPNRYNCILCPWHRLFVPREDWRAPTW